MFMKILDGKALANTIRERLKTEVARAKDKPTLVIIQIGNRPESNVYVGHKKKFGDSIGAVVKHIVFGEDVTTETLISEIKKLNKNKKVHGVIVQLPIPAHLDKKKIIEAVDPRKDVDGLSSVREYFWFR
jgi:5,10-methylene-tetrahydrofolate dehydrogenase/methenyl tetrahydrofolate cyclohydrolase